MNELILALKSANSERSEKRTEMLRNDYYGRLFQFLESRFEDGEEYKVQNYFETYKLETKNAKGENKTVYGFICDNNKSYLGLNDLAFAKKLYRREIKKVDGEETTTYTQLPNKIEQGDLAKLFFMFKSRYKDALVAFDLLYCAIAKHNNNTFVSESYIYPVECFQRFKGEYVTSNFYLFNLKIGGTSKEKLEQIFADICGEYENSLKEAKAPEAPQAEAPQATA